MNVIHPEDYLSILTDDTNQDLHLSSQLTSLADQTDDVDLQFKLNTEIKCFDLYLNDGHLTPVIQFANYVKTEINSLTPEEINYIHSRAVEESDAFLCARYHHILFQKNRHQQHAVKAISAYEILSDHYFAALPGQELCIHDLMEVVKAGHELSVITKQSPVEERQRILNWFNTPQQALFFYQNIVEIIATSKLFKRTDVMGLTAKALSLCELALDELDKEYYLEICLQLAKKEGYPINEIYELMADAQLIQFHKELEDTGKIMTASPLKAAILYKKAGNHKKSNEVLREIEQQKRSVFMDSIIYEPDQHLVREANRAFEDFAYKITDGRYSVFVHLATNPNFLITSDSYSPDPENAFLNHIITTVYDININSRFLSEYDLKRRDIFLHFQMHLEMHVIYLMFQVKKQMQEKNEDFVAEGLEYFKNSWFGRKLGKNVLGEDPIIYEWYPSLKPALTILLQTKMEVRGTKLTAEEQMAFDQLSIKFEGLLRDLCQMIKITTTKLREEQMVAQDINDLLKNPELLVHFEKQDLELWQFILTGSGYNIRNDVAHSFYRDVDYNVEKAQLLLLAYIRLSKYGRLIN